MEYDMQQVLLDCQNRAEESCLDVVIGSVESVYIAPHPRLLLLQATRLFPFFSSSTDAPVLASLFAGADTVVERVAARESRCDTGLCPFNYNLKHGANPTEESFTLSAEGLDDLVFSGIQDDANKRMAQLTCVASGTYVLRLSPHYANMPNPLFIYGKVAMNDFIYSYSDNGSEIQVSC